MRILHTSDWHLGRSLENISRIEEQREFIDQLCDIADEERIDLVLVAGDVYDSYNPSAAAEELFYYALDRLNAGGGRAVVVIAGNHDNPERLCASNPLASNGGLYCWATPAAGPLVNTAVPRPGLWTPCRLTEVGFPGATIRRYYCLPYPSEARLEQLLTRETDEKRLRGVFGQGGQYNFSPDSKYRATVNLPKPFIYERRQTVGIERVLQVGGALTVEPEVLPAGPFHGLGHLHGLSESSPHLSAYYSGSPLPTAFAGIDYAKAFT